MKLLQLTAVAATAMFGVEAWAADLQKEDSVSYPVLTGEIALELGYDNTYSSQDPAAEVYDLYPTVTGAFDLKLNENFLFHTDLVLEPVFDPTGNRAFEDIGIYAETLHVQYQMNAFSFIAGKYNPTFGTAWDATPGIYGPDMAEDYQLTERLGLAVGVGLGEEGAGLYNLQVNAFFADTTFLSQSVGTDRGRTKLASGGASNTEALESFSATLDATAFDSMPGFSYHLGFVHQAKGVGGVDDENGFVIGAQKEVELAEDRKLNFLIEFAHLKNAAGGADDISYATAGLGYTFGQWNAALASTQRWTDVSGGADVKDFQIQGSLGYEFENGVTFDVGYKFNEEGGVENHTAGFRLGKTIGF